MSLGANKIREIFFLAALVLFGHEVSATEGVPKRPVVFVPGIIGSILADESGNVVWGNAGSLKGRNFHRMNLLPENSPAEPLKSAGILRDVPLLFGAIEIGVYAKALDFLVGETTFADYLTGNPVKGHYVDGETLFVFSYDWRRSNFANALKLDSFIRKHVPSGEYDVIAHSMGGIITRIMLSQKGPATLCTSGSADDAGLDDAGYQDLCTAIYGAPPGGTWPSDHLNAGRPAAGRLHTFMEIAVPHYGSVNLAATLMEGWGRISERLLGGKLAIQNTVLSMTAPVELLPTYARCCARGAAGASGNEQVDPYDEDYWLTSLLGFGLPTCPYERCALRRALFRNGMANRKIIDGIMDAGLPRSVRANHVIFGRLVETRETLYVSFQSAGNGDSVSYRPTMKGDGTVHEQSALPPANQQTQTFTNELAVMRAKHPFVPSDAAATTYIYNMLVDPARTPIKAVSGEVMEFAGGAVETAKLTLAEKVILTGMPFDVILDVADQDESPFVPEQARTAQIQVALLRPGTDETLIELAPLTLNADFSLLTQGELAFDRQGYVVEQPGFYTMILTSGEVELARENIYVVEEE